MKTKFIFFILFLTCNVFFNYSNANHEQCRDPHCLGVIQKTGDFRFSDTIVLTITAPSEGFLDVYGGGRPYYLRNNGSTLFIEVTYEPGFDDLDYFTFDLVTLKGNFFYHVQVNIVR